MMGKRSLWDEKLSVGIKQFDDHHKKLLDIIVRIQDSMSGGKELTFLKDILYELLSYSKYHFSAEQRLMKQYDYSRYDEHILMHDFFIKKIETFINKYNRNDKDLNNEMLVFLKEWLIHHIIKIDKDYGGLLKSHGVE